MSTENEDDEPEDEEEEAGGNGGAPAPGDLSRSQIVETAREIAESYAGQGLKLTVRQLYYQFVARGLLGSGQRVYKRVVAALSEARLEGRFPMDLIEDRGRDAGAGDAVVCEDLIGRALGNCKDAIGGLPSRFLRYGRWWGQPAFVSVWVEKEALAGVFEAPCKELGVGLFPCKGYPSVSALYQWLKHLARACDEEPGRNDDGWRCAGKADRAVVLYFGDHDPDGWEIPRSCERNLETMIRNGLVSVDVPITFERIALNMDQVRQYNPPPFEAKMSSSRYAGYRREHGTDKAWELDALEPTVLQRLIRDSVNRFWIASIFEENKTTIHRRRRKLRERMLADGWFQEAIGGN